MLLPSGELGDVALRVERLPPSRRAMEETVLSGLVSNWRAWRTCSG
jgi:hypothetical protein